MKREIKEGQSHVSPEERRKPKGTTLAVVVCGKAGRSASKFSFPLFAATGRKSSTVPGSLMRCDTAAQNAPTTILVESRMRKDAVSGASAASFFNFYFGEYWRAWLCAISMDGRPESKAGAEPLLVASG